MNIVKGKVATACRAVLYGPEGVGKSTLASHWPRPLFLDIEGGTNQLAVDRVSAIPSWGALAAAVKEFHASPGEYRTLVVDTVDAAERLCQRHVCGEKGVGNIEDFGFGKGYVVAATAFAKFLDYLTRIADNGIHVVLVGHSQVRKFELPDEAGAFDKYELQADKRVAAAVKQWADLLLFANYETFVVESDAGKGKGKAKATGGRRVMFTSHHPCWDAKNRYGLADKLPLDFAALGPVFADVPAPTPPAPPAPAPIPTEEDNLDYETQERQAIQEPEPQPQTMPSGLQTCPEGFPAVLWDLMDADGVTDAEVRAVVAGRGWYPDTVPIGQYDERLVNALVANWHAKIVPAVHQNRQQ